MERVAYNLQMFILFIFLALFLFYVFVCYACMYACVPCVFLVPMVLEEDIGPFRTELQTGMSHHMGGGNQAQLIWNSNSCF